MDITQILLAVTEAATEAEVSSGLLGTLGINWKLFLAQLINFGLVLFVFWKWVVGPLGKALADRQNRIEEGLKNADLMQSEKKKFEEWKMNEMKKVRSEADHILRTTTDTANQVKQQTIVEAQKQAAKTIEQAKSSIESEKAQMMKEAKTELATLVVAASEKILKSKLDSRQDHELINKSLRR